MQEYLYVLLSEDGKAIKLGYSKRPTARMQDLQRIYRDRYGNITLLGTLTGTMRRERQCHRVLDRLSASLGNEWFVLNGPVQDFIDILLRASDDPTTIPPE